MADDDFWSNLGASLVELGVSIAVSSAISQALGQGGSAKGGNLKSLYAQKQSRPPVTRFVGDYSRSAPAFALYDVFGNGFHQIFAISDGRLDDTNGICKEVWLGDDKVAWDGTGRVTSVLNGANDGRYVDSPGQRVNLKFRAGLATETAYAEAISAFAGKWTTNHRGDGTGSLMMRLFAPDPKFKGTIFPNGGSFNVSVVARGVCYDWRDTSQNRLNPATWKWSANPVVWLVHKETQFWGLDWAYSVAPVLSDLTSEANYCDASVALAAGGTEPRYRVAFNYKGDETEDSVRQKILAAMAGYRSLDGQGHLIVRAGRYLAPTVTLTDRNILSAAWSQGSPTEDGVDRLNVSFNSSASGYQPVDCDPWIINADGTRTRDLYIEGCPSFSQARRLAKIMASQLSPRSSGHFETDDTGLLAWGERFVRLQIPGSRYMQDLVVELPEGGEFSDAGFSYAAREADPNAYAWNPATEEGRDPGSATATVYDPLPQPVINAATAFYDLISDGSYGARIEIDALGPSRDDLAWAYRWRIAGASTWAEASASESGTSVLIPTGFVPVNASVEVEVAYRTGSVAFSDWSSTTTVSTSTDTIAPSPPTSLTATGGSGQATLSWRNSTTANFDHVILRRGTTNVYGASSGVGTFYGAPGAVSSFVNTGLPAGTYYYWVTAYNAAGANSANTGPQTATVT